MAFPNFVYLTNASSGATRNSGTNGDFNTLMNWALPQVGWAREYHDGATFESVFRPATGNRFRFYCAHNSALSGGAQRVVIRGCENASSASILTDPFPTVAQVAAASSNTIVSTLANTTDRAFHIIAWDTGFIYASNVGGAANRWQLMGYADLVPNVDTDTWGTVIWGVRELANNTTITSPAGSTIVGSGGLIGTYWARAIDGTVKATHGNWHISSGAIGGSSGLLDASNCYLGKIRKERVAINCNASQSTTAGSVGIIRRGFLPQVWNGLYSGIGSVTDADTFSDPTGATFIMLGAASDNISFILQTSNDWIQPST